MRDINPAPDAGTTKAAHAVPVPAIVPASFVPDLLARLGVALPGAGMPASFDGKGFELPASFDGMRFKMPAADVDQVAEVDVAQQGGAAGQFLAASFANHAGSRAYKLYVPTGYHGQALPLVVMLHGCKQHPDDFAAGTGFNALAEETPCLVLYPAQAQSANVSACWNWFGAGDQQRGQGEPAIIAGMTQQVIADYGIDPAQVYIAGLSAGGAMAAIMGRTYPELYRAVGIHSGLPYGAAHDLPSALAAMKHGATAQRGAAALPVIVFHGERDPTVHPRNADQIVMQAGGRSGPGHDQAKVKVTVNVTKGRADGGHNYTRTVHEDADGKVLAEQWLVHGAGHAWSGGSLRGSYTDRKGPDASREMMRFFSAQNANRTD
jgi:poly(hydroxyalkanoate) depolymerase family esterase